MKNLSLPFISFDEATVQKISRILLIAFVVGLLLMLATHVNAQDVGFVKYKKQVVDVQGGAAYGIIKWVALIIGFSLMVTGFYKLTRERKDGAIMLILVGGSLVVSGFFIQTIAEGITNKKLDGEAKTIMGNDYTN